MSHRLTASLTAVFALMTMILFFVFLEGVAASAGQIDEAAQFDAAMSATGTGPAPDLEMLSEAHQRMVYQVAAQVNRILAETDLGTVGGNVQAALRKVHRHHFVPPHLAEHAYRNQPLPLIQDQNLSAPFVTALMTQLLQVEPGDRVFETGTDSGYQAAILAEMGARVYSMEIVAPLTQIAKNILTALGYNDRVSVRQGDGFYGWEEAGPFDAILVKEAVNEIPLPLLRQLRTGGRMVLPLGPNSGQEISVITKHGDGSISIDRVMEVTFSPFQGGERI